jgi:hypothetical protein
LESKSSPSKCLWQSAVFLGSHWRASDPEPPDLTQRVPPTFLPKELPPPSARPVSRSTSAVSISAFHLPLRRSPLRTGRSCRSRILCRILCNSASFQRDTHGLTISGSMA